MKTNKIASIIVIIISVLAIAIGILVPLRAPDNAVSQYFCDVNAITTRLNINVSDMNSNKLFTIKGEFWNIAEDNLVMFDTEENVTREMRDDYNLIFQNDHYILDGNGFRYRMDGNFKVFADSYTVYDNKDQHVADIVCSWGMTGVTMTDVDGNVIAQCTSNLIRQDYIVSIFENCEIDDECVLIMFASCVSDARADNE